MKVIFSFLIGFFLFVSVLSALSMSSSSSGRIRISGGEGSAAFRKDGLLLKTGVVSFGSVSGGGIISLIDNPYSSSSVLPSFSLSSSKAVTGTALHVSRFTLFSFYGERDGAGLSYDGSAFDVTLLYAQAGEDGSFQKDRVRRTDSSTLWSALSYEWKEYVKLTLLGSMNEKGSFSSLFNASLTLSSLSVSYGMGRVQAFLDSSKPWYSSLSLSIDDERFEIEHRIFLARTPVYLREYRDYEYRVKGKLYLGEFSLSDTITKTFLSGRTEREEKTSLSWRAFTLGYKRSTDSFYASMEEGGVEAVWEDGKLTVTLTEVFTRGNITITMKISSKGTVSWVLSYGDAPSSDDTAEDI